MTAVAPSPQTPSGRGLTARRQRPSEVRLRNQVSRHDGLIALFVYLAIALIWYRAVVAHLNSNCACGLGPDPGDGAEAVWWLEWFAHALGNGQSLMHTTSMWTPTGINMYGTAASLFYGAASAPLTLIWGPIVPFNLTMILAPVLSAWAANRLCRYISGSAPASWLAGAAFGFSTYEIGHLVGHVNIAMFVCPPLLALCVLRLLSGDTSNRRFVIQASLLLLVQIFISVEVLFTMTVIGVVALAVGWLTGDSGQRRHIVQKLPVLTLPYVIAALASSWYLLRVLGSATYAHGVGDRFPTDALSLFVPMQYTLVGGAALARVSSNFRGGYDETTSYLGIPLLLIMGHYLITRRHTRTARILAALTALTIIWILGPVLWWDGRPIIRLPYQLIAGLPVLRYVQEGRVSVYLALLASVILAIWLASPRRRWLAGWACALVAVIFVMPNFVHPSANNVSTWTNPTFFRTEMYRRYLQRGTSIMPINWGGAGESFMWQAEDHMYWNMANGYWRFPPPPGWRSQLTMDLWVRNEAQPGDAALLRSMLIRRRVSALVVQDDSVARWRKMIAAAGLRQSISVGGVTLFPVPRAWRT